ncbi:hypothetical protein [Agromyces lapidis]|uniref:Uncharacterized protein n=1 Tax=Agromyces lapidis TaxID=279574 RepID=A0ABV5SQG1_9MICO|nr:hypothetical protein [Agromyces lapidis]
MTLDPNHAPQPALQPPVPPAPAPEHPARPKGLAAALTAAILVSALPLLGMPVFFVWIFAVAFDQVAAYSSEAEAAEHSTSTLAADIPIDLPWDVRLGGDAYTWWLDSLPYDDAWVPGDGAGERDGNFTNATYENVESGCTVWFSNAPLESIDGVTDGDRAASIAFLEFTLGVATDDDDVIDAAISTVDAEEGTEWGLTDAVAVDVSDDVRQRIAVARAFPSIGEGVIYTVDCADRASLESSLENVELLLTLALTSAQ